MKEKDLKKDHLMHVQIVSANHYILLYTVSIYLKEGNSDPSEIFSNRRVLIGHASGYMILFTAPDEKNYLVVIIITC